MQKSPLLFSSYFQRNHWRKKFSKQKKVEKTTTIFCWFFMYSVVHLAVVPYSPISPMSLSEYCLSLKTFFVLTIFGQKSLDCYYFIKWTFPLKEMVLYVLLHTFFSTAVYKYITFAKMKISFTLINLSEQYQKETLLNLNSYLSILYFSQFHILNTLSWQLASAQFAQPCFWWEKLLAASVHIHLFFYCLESWWTLFEVKVDIHAAKFFNCKLLYLKQGTTGGGVLNILPNFLKAFTKSGYL